MVVTPPATATDELTLSVTTTFEARTETVPLTLQVVMPAQMRL